MTIRVEMGLGGRPLSLETGKLAGQADGAVVVAYGESALLVTACASEEPREGIDFFPLTVDYEERMYAAGKIPGGFIKREGRPSTDATLAARLTDRPLRPLFPKGFRNDVQIISTVLSADQVNDPDILSIIGASAALSISSIPFFGPVAATRVGYLNDALVINPTEEQVRESRMDLVVAGTRDAIMMVEAGIKEVPEDVVLEALRVGQETNVQIIELQDRFVAEAGKPKREVKLATLPEELVTAVEAYLADKLPQALAPTTVKAERETALSELRKDTLAQFGETWEPKEILAAVEGMTKRLVRAAIIERGERPDGRDPKTIRPIACEIGILPRTHGSGLFTRGQTQVLTVVTLGSLANDQLIDGLGIETNKTFMHHYNMPPFSNGEVKRLGSPGRREIGHGALAERAIAAVVPPTEEFPYTIRLVSEVLSSNGSTSMASVCGSTLALMDAGVPIKAPVAGIAMGLVMNESGQFQVLTDIQGIEDNLGDMDFKVAGTREGITALQMDIKIKGITPEVMQQALAQARDARLFILDKIVETIPEPRAELSAYAPRMTKMMIHPDKIRNVIGPGGKTIRSIIEQCKVTIDVQDDGTVIIGSPNEDATKKAMLMIDQLTRDVEIGAIYLGKVTRLTGFGAFVEILPGKEGLVRTGDLADYPVGDASEVVDIGDEIQVMVIEIDRQGRVNLSRRAVFEGAPARPSGFRGGGGGFGDRGPRPSRPPMGGGDRPRGPRPDQGPPRRDNGPAGGGRRW